MKFRNVLFFCFLLNHATAQTIDSLALVNFSDAAVEIQNSEIFRHGTIGISVRSVKSGRNIFALNQERSLPSASILKLVSTATVLNVMGGDYQYSTFLEYRGRISGDTLIGNIYVRGTGDPSLASGRFKGYPAKTEMVNRWVAAVKKLGIKHIKGEVLSDTWYFDKEAFANTWIWGDIGNYYGAGPWGLNFNENMYTMRFKAGPKVGDETAMIGSDPEMPYVSFQNRVTTGERGSGDQTIFYSDPLGTNVLMTGTIPAGSVSFGVKGSITEPGKYVAYALANALKQTGIHIVEKEVNLKDFVLPASVVLDEYKSPPLKDLCREANYWSINLYADAFFKLVGKKLGGSSEYDNAVKMVTSYWSSKGADLRGFMIKDGSGLSPSGSVTPLNMTEILRFENKERSFADFYQSIAVIGQNGTVRNLGKGIRAAGNMHVKSGSIEGTRAFAGYVTSKSGELLCFSIIAHKYQPGSQRLVGDDLGRLMILLGNL